MVIDEVGCVFPLGNESCDLFFQVISAGRGKKSTVLQRIYRSPIGGKIYDSTAVATAIADRLVNNSEVIIMEGTSYRTKPKAKDKMIEG